LHAATAPGPLSPKDVVAAILAGKPLPTGEDPADYIRRADSPALRAAITQAYVAAAEAGDPPSGASRPRRLLVRALAKAKALDILGELVSIPPTSPFDTMSSLRAIGDFNVGSPFLEFLKTHSAALAETMESLPERDRAVYPVWLAQRKRLHMACQAILTAAREHADDPAHQLTAALIRGDAAFQDTPIYVWIRLHGLSATQKSTILAAHTQITRAVSSKECIGPVIAGPGGKLFAALMAGKAADEAVEAATTDVDKMSADAIVYTLTMLCPDDFTVAVLTKLADSLPWERPAEHARMAARRDKAALQEYAAAWAKLKDHPKDLPSLRALLGRQSGMLSEAEFFSDTEGTLACRKESLQILNIILEHDDANALAHRAHVHEALGNTRLATTDVDRLILGTEDDSLQPLAGLRTWREKLLREAAEAEKP